jgi:hypothetical protein
MAEGRNVLRVFELCLSAVSTGKLFKPYKIVVKKPQVTGSEWFGTHRYSGNLADDNRY